MEMERISAVEASKLLGIPTDTLYLGLQQNRFPFGFAVKKKQWVYCIYREKLMQYIQAS